MSSKMQAAEIVKYRKPYQLRERPLPRCREHDLLDRVHAAGFCHSDLQVLNGQFPIPDLPMILSHEPAGEIVQTGAAVQGSWKIGDRVGILNFKNACGSCVGCRQHTRRATRPDPRFCQRREMAGFRHHGHLCVQFAKALGYKTVAIDNHLEGRQLAQDLPNHLRPELIIDSTASKADEEILEFTSGEGLAGIVVCTDSVPANAWSFQQLGNKGVMVPLGLPAEKWQFDSEVMVFRELTIKGSYVASVEEVENMFEIVAEQGISSHLTILNFDQIPSLEDW
ncbi:hypothetical protein SNOG_04882 [Parastagonospora nodorum SN15]|uniref:Enoyl reductase (ER) domain-containing protein n=1 Tax=Phaeosphaeria nodorum (strain SN15 / ATCC MYA-4574 / FGSC 10173) TaxID=321614 RepID=Q0UTN2_PHANO|nr:hypothetical protein SNOG_04882 [Parastagonospora nodorum SN15]EAT87273.1 hypothetical protein SNOG_04882 [Parastagonospora nodorum SN15]